jgi:cytochrome P450
VEPVKASFLARPEFKANPHPFYARMRAEAPVFRIAAPFYGRAWLITRHRDVLGFLKDDRFSREVTAKMPWLPRFARPLADHMLGKDAPDHTRLRGLVSQAFTPRRIEELRARIQTVCEDLLAAAPRESPFDLVRGYALPIPLTIIAELLGIPVEDRHRFHTLTRGAMTIGAPTRLLDLPMALPYVFLLMRYFRNLFEQRRADPRGDLLSALVQAEEAGDRLSEDELLGTSILLLFAGYETTVNLIASGALALLQDSDQRSRFVHEPALAEPAIEELLRYTSPVEITPPRLAREEVTLSSVTLARGDFVAAVLGSANRDEEQFKNPEMLDLGRAPNRHVAFGHGPHFCLGASLARMEGQIALTTLFRLRPGVRLAQTPGSLRWRKILPLRGLEALPVVL